LYWELNLSYQKELLRKEKKKIIIIIYFLKVPLKSYLDQNYQKKKVPFEFWVFLMLGLTYPMIILKSKRIKKEINHFFFFK